MHALPIHRRIVLVTGDQLGVFTAKTAVSVLRYRAADVVGVLDQATAGRDIRDLLPGAPAVPIVPDWAAATALQPDALYVGIAPAGGALPAALRVPIAAALMHGVDVVSGLHMFLAEDAEFARLARDSGARIFDLRRPPAQRVIAAARARATRCRRVLTVGTDGNVGKMVTALELTALARRQGRNAQFLATGQTGIMIEGRGISIDACIADFAPGAVEEMVLSVADSDVCFVEGQGSIAHPGFSPVTLALLHGACPDAMVLVHAVGRSHYRTLTTELLPGFAPLIVAYEQMAAFLHPARVVAVALNTVGHPPAAAQAAVEVLERELGLPVADPVRDGCERLLAACL